MFDDKPAKPRVLFLSLTNDVGSQRPVAEMGRLGCECGVLSPPGFHCAETRFVAQHFPLPRHFGLWFGIFWVRSRLERIARSWRPSLIAPLDDVSVWLLRALVQDRRTSQQLRRLLEMSFGPPVAYPAARSRASFTQFARKIGVRAPKSVAADAANAVEAASEIGFPLALKLEGSCGGFGVKIARDPAELRARIDDAGYGRWGFLRLRRSFLKRVKEIARRVVWRLAGLPSIPVATYELQEFISGAAAMRVVSAWRGQVLDGVSFLAERVNPPPFGPSTVIRHIDNAEMEESARRLTEALGLSGFACFDFIVEPSGRAYVNEMNARPVGSIHLGSRFGHDVCGALVRELGGETTANQSPGREERLIALFPNELERDPDGALFESGSGVFHDVPWDDPPSIQSYYQRLSRKHPDRASDLALRLGVSASPQGGRLLYFLRKLALRAQGWRSTPSHR